MKNLRALAVFGCGAFLCLSANGAEILKANNTNALNLSTSWQGGVVPGVGDIATWTNNSGSSVVSLGANTAWKGIKVYTPGATPSIAGGYTLSLGSGGIVLGGNNFNMTNTLVLTTNQTWDLGTKVLYMRGPIAGTNVTLNIVSGAYVDMISSAANLIGTINYAASDRFHIMAFNGTNVAVNIQTPVSFNTYSFIGTARVGDLSTTNTGAVIGGRDQNGTVTYEVGALGLNSTWAGRIQNGTSPISITKVGDGTWTLTGSNTYSGLTSIKSGKILANNTAGSATGTGDIKVFFGATLGGTGTVGGSVSNFYGSSIVPGLGHNQMGTLTVRGRLDLGGSARFVLNRGASPNSSRLVGIDMLNATGGELVVTNLGAALQSGDTFTLFSATNYTGNFESFNLPPLASGLAWSTQFLPIDGTLRVGQPATITTAPANRSVACGGQTTFTVSASGSSPLSYQWSINGTPVAGATGSSYTWTNVSSSGTDPVVSVRVSNPYGTDSATAAVLLTDTAAPAIAAQPQSRTNMVGTAAEFEVVGSSCGPLSYQWYRGTQALSGETGARLTLANVQLADADEYKVRLANSAGAVTSSVAQLTVISYTPSSDVLTMENDRLRVEFNTNSAFATVLNKHTGKAWQQVSWTTPEGIELLQDRRFEQADGAIWDWDAAWTPVTQLGVPALKLSGAGAYAQTTDGVAHLSRLKLVTPIAMNHKTYHLRFRCQRVGFRDLTLATSVAMYDSSNTLLTTVVSNLVFIPSYITDTDYVEREVWIPAHLVPPTTATAVVYFNATAGSTSAGSLYVTDVRLVGGNLMPNSGFTTMWSGGTNWAGVSLTNDPAATPYNVLKVDAAAIPTGSNNRVSANFVDISARTYRVSFRYKTVGLMNLTVKARHAGLVPDHNLVYGATATTTPWTEYSYEVTTTNGVTFYDQFDFVKSTGAAGQFYLTDAEVVPTEPGPITRALVSSATQVSSSEIQYTFNTAERIKANPTQPSLTCSVTLGSAPTNLNELNWTIISSTNTALGTIYAAPAFVPVNPESIQWLMPNGEGVLLPGSDIFDPINRRVDSQLTTWTHEQTLAMHGVITAEGDGYYLINDTPVCTDVYYKASQVTPQYYVYMPFVGHRGSKGKLEHPRSVSYRFVDEGTGYVGIAKDYLANYAQPRGYHVTYAEKAKHNPGLMNYVGTPSLLGGLGADTAIEQGLISTLKAAGIDRATLRTTNIDVAAAAQAAGWNTYRYDNYWDSIHQVFEDNDWLKRNADGTVTDTGWGSGTNHLYVCCPDYIEQVARQEIPLWNAGLNHQTWFIDVFATVSAYSCYSTNHPATELDTLAARVAICKYITEELGMAFWTEGAGEFLVPYAVYGEGPMSSYGVSGASPKYRIPLWSLVYHDCWENSWHTFGGNLNADANIWKTNDLYNTLYASKQLMGFTADPNSSVYFYKPGLIENAVKSIREVTKVTQQVGLYEMVDHRFLSQDGNVQMTRYKNGVDVYVNFGGSDFTYGDLVIPAQGSITRKISEILKANNTDNLNEITSWQSLTVPGPDDYAAWTNGSGSSAVSLGNNASWYGIKVYNPGATPQILAGNSLTLGAGGITLSGNNFSFSNRMVLDRDQTWNLGTKALFARGPIAGNNVTINITSPASSYVDMLGSLADFTGTINYSAPARLRVLRFDGDSVVVNMQSGAAFDAYGYNGTTVVGDLITTNKNAALGGGDQNGTVTYEIGALGNDSTWAGRILNGGTGSTPTSIRKVGSGKWTLSGTNTYTGSTMIDGGTLALSGIGSLPNSSLIAISDNATLSVSGLSSTFTLGATQTLSNNASTTGNLNGNLQTSSGTVSISYVSGTPAFSIGNGTLTLSSSTVFNINNTGSALAAGSYKIVSKGTGGAVNGTMPSVVITGGGVAAGTSWGLGAISGELYLVSLPNTPTGLSATGSNAVVRLTWNASSGATSYKVKRATVSGGPYTVVGSPAGTSYTDSGLVNGTTYYYVVSAVNAGGESTNSAQDSATTVAPPLAPGGFTATGSNAVVFLDWNASSGATSYQLKRASVSGGPYTVLSSPTATSYTDNAVVNDTTYYYVVSAVNAGGESANSAQASATPAVPEILKANNANNLNLGSSWQGGVVPGASQYAAWTNGSGSSAVSLGANASWYGLKIYNPGATPQILAGNSLTLGEGGIALSGNNFAFSNTLIVAADQVWKLGSKALFARGPITGTNVTIDITSSISSYVDMVGSLSNFSGTINYAAPARLRVLRFDGDNLVLNMQSGASFDAYGYNGTTIVGDLITTNKNAALGGGDQNGTVTYQIGALGNNSTWAGRILNGGSGTTPTSIRKVGAGKWTLSGTNTYTGSTVVNDGTLALSGIGDIPNTSLISITNGATLDVSGLNSTFTLGASQTLSNNASSTGSVKGDVNTSSGTVSVSYVSGTPSLSIGSGTLTLSSSTTFEIDNTGSALAAGSYKIISKATGGTVVGTPPAVSVAAGGLASGTSASLTITSGELYLVVQNAGGAAVVTLPPLLMIKPVSNTVEITWPSDYANFILERRAGLTGDWQPVTGVLSNNYSEPAISNGFFRLKSQ